MSILSFVQSQDASRFTVGDKTLDAGVVAGYMQLIEQGKNVYSNPSRHADSEAQKQPEFPNLGEYALANELLEEYQRTQSKSEVPNAELTYRILPTYVTRRDKELLTGFKITWVEQAHSGRETRSWLTQTADASPLHLHTDYDYGYAKISFPLDGMYRVSEIEGLVTSIRRRLHL